jgi:hypothetical protein
MADLEAHAIRRDRRFLVRLVLLLVLGVFAGLWIFGFLTSRQTGSCVATFFGGADAKPPAH